MKIAFCHTDLRLYWPARLRALRDFLEARGADLHVFEIAGAGSPYVFAGASCDRSAWWHCLFPDQRMEDLPPARCSAALFLALDELKPEVVVGGAVAYPSGATAVRWASERRRPVIIFDDARRMDVPRNAFVNWVKRRIYARVDAMLIPAPSHQPDYQFWGIPPQQVFHGVNVVDNVFFARHATSVRAEREEYHQKAQLPPRFLLGVGRQVKKKNWDGLLQAWLRFKEQRPKSDLHLVLVGNGPERPMLEALACCDRGEPVVFRDFADPQQVAVHYALATALVLPSREGETWGLVVNEAMASGLPVLVSRQCGCASTLVEPGKNGWLFDAHDRDSILRSLLSLDSATPDQLACFGNRSSEIIARWGLNRFCEGTWEAIEYARRTTSRCANLTDRFLLRSWNGRYRPT